MLGLLGDHGALGRVQIQTCDAGATVIINSHEALRRRFHSRTLGHVDAVFLLHALEHAVVGGHGYSFLAGRGS